MTEKEFRKLSRLELLEILTEQSRRIEELSQKLEETEKKLQSRKLQIEKAGSIAEASLQLNRVFEAAQAAADQYLENVRYINENKREENKEQ